MSVHCQRVEYRYNRSQFRYSAQWQRTGVAVSELLEGVGPGFRHQVGETNTAIIVFAVPFSDNEDVFNATQIEYEALADARFEQTHPGQKLVDSAARHSPVTGVAIGETFRE
jgi:hypothetical protein